MLTLRRLTKTDEQAFFTAYKEWGTPEHARIWFSCCQSDMSFDDLLLEVDNECKGIGLAEGWVPCTVMYGVVDGSIVGRLSIRHKLTDALQIFGGHIGYATAPKHRHKGYASSMLKQALPMCVELGIKEALLTIDKLNYASIMVVKKCGGILADEFWDVAHHRTTQRWTIKL